MALASFLMLLSIVIAGAGWYAISEVSAALAESIRVARQAQFVTVGIREFAGADRRVVGYLQTATDGDEQIYTTRKADSDAAFGEALDLVRDPGRRQAMLDARQNLRDYFATADAIIRDRKALRQRVAGIQEALVALPASTRKKRDSAQPPAQRLASMDSLRRPPLVGPKSTASTRSPSVAGRGSRANDVGLVVATPAVLPDTGAFSESSKPDVGGTGLNVELLQHIGDAAQLVALDPSEATLANYAAAMQAFGDATPTSDAAAARLLLVAREATAAARTILQSYDKLQETEPAFMDKLKALRLELTAFAGEIANGAVATAASGTSEVIYASAFAVVFGSVLAWFIVRGIIVPLNAMTGAMTGLAAGDGTVDIPEMRSKSELGAMARAVDVFKQNADKIAAMLTAETTTREIGEVISGAAAGDLTIRVPLDNKVGFLRDIGEQVNRLLNATNAAFKEFGEKARHTAISVGEASAAVGQVSDGARSQSSALSQVATALKGINGFQLDKKARRNNTCQGGLRSIKGQGRLWPAGGWHSRSTPAPEIPVRSGTYASCQEGTIGLRQ